MAKQRKRKTGEYGAYVRNKKGTINKLFLSITPKGAMDQARRALFKRREFTGDCFIQPDRSIIAAVNRGIAI